MMRGRRPEGGCLTFARGAAPERVIEAFGMDPGAARILPEALARETLSSGQWVRVGRLGDWAFAIEEIWLAGLLEDVGVRLSLGTEAAVISWTAKPTSDLRYLLDGAVVTAFEPAMAWDRSGREPDRLLPQMRQVGLETERPQPPRSPRRRDRLLRFDPLVAGLELLTLALGIRLPEEVARGPLLSCRREPDAPTTTAPP